MKFFILSALTLGFVTGLFATSVSAAGSETIKLNSTQMEKLNQFVNAQKIYISGAKETTCSRWSKTTYLSFPKKGIFFGKAQDESYEKIGWADNTNKLVCASSFNEWHAVAPSVEKYFTKYAPTEESLKDKNALKQIGKVIYKENKFMRKVYNFHVEMYSQSKRIGKKTILTQSLAGDPINLILVTGYAKSIYDDALMDGLVYDHFDKNMTLRIIPQTETLKLCYRHSHTKDSMNNCLDEFKKKFN